MEDVYQSFLRDLVSWLRLRAEDAAKGQGSDAPEAVFEVGRATAYVEVLGFMQSQADVFLIDRNEVNLDGFEAYALLATRREEGTSGT